MPEYVHAQHDDTGWEGEAATREEAVEDAIKHYDYEDGFFTAVKKEASFDDVLPFIAGMVVDAVLENESLDEYYCETWLNDFRDTALTPALGGRDTRLIVDLDNRLRAAFIDWCLAHGIAEPNWYYAENIVHHNADGSST